MATQLYVDVFAHVASFLSDAVSLRNTCKKFSTTTYTRAIRHQRLVWLQVLYADVQYVEDVQTMIRPESIYVGSLSEMFPDIQSRPESFTLEANAWPTLEEASSVRTTRKEDRYHPQFVERKMLQTLLERVTYVTFGCDAWKEPVPACWWPPKVTKLNFQSWVPETILRIQQFPTALKSLTVYAPTSCFHSKSSILSVLRNTAPNLEEINIQKPHRVQWITLNLTALPATLKILRIDGCYDGDLSQLPYGLHTLQVHGQLLQPLLMLPPALTSLTVDCWRNGSFDLSANKCLTDLSIGLSYSEGQPLVIPSSLVTLRGRGHAIPRIVFEQPCKVRTLCLEEVNIGQEGPWAENWINLPQTLTALTIGPCAGHVNFHNLHALLELSMKHWEGSMLPPVTQLPKSLEKLYIRNRRWLGKQSGEYLVPSAICMVQLDNMMYQFDGTTNELEMEEGGILLRDTVKPPSR